MNLSVKVLHVSIGENVSFQSRFFERKGLIMTDKEILEMAPNTQTIDPRVLRTCGFKSIGEAWDSYCVDNDIHYGIGATPVMSDRFVNYVKQMYADICSDCCDDGDNAPFGEEY